MRVICIKKFIVNALYEVTFEEGKEYTLYTDESTETEFVRAGDNGFSVNYDMYKENFRLSAKMATIGLMEVSKNSEKDIYSGFGIAENVLKSNNYIKDNSTVLKEFLLINKKLNEIPYTKYKIFEKERTLELLENNPEIIKTNDFLIFYYWCTNLNISYLQKFLNTTMNAASIYNCIIKSIVSDKLVIITRCKFCNKSIFYYPNSRAERDHYILHKNNTCEKCSLTNSNEMKDQESKINKTIESNDNKIVKNTQLKTLSKEEKNINKSRVSAKDKLTTEILRFMKYPEYLQTDHWKETRQKALKKAKYKCELCYSKEKLNVHHKTYENKGNEKDEDLIVLCEDCHAKFHDKLPSEDKDVEEVKTKDVSFEDKLDWLYRYFKQMDSNFKNLHI